MLNSETFLGMDANQLSVDDQEHITKYFYAHPENFRILNIESSNPSLAKISLAVDSVEDLIVLENKLQEPQYCLNKKKN
jgi:spore coat polysaccharide biosynthesis protein SpsF (cytidylyltransferase family)